MGTVQFHTVEAGLGQGREASLQPVTRHAHGRRLSPQRVDVPPGQIRTFEAVLSFIDRPPVKGVAVWEHRVIATRGTTSSTRPASNPSSLYTMK